ncbi:hypothetical protein PCK2_000821 [Pneumocystis canis]|nr:hypothetical protein PCK2_000821 [Pneumocystis canis]
MGQLDTRDAQHATITKQLVLLQLQTLVVGIVSGLIAFLLSLIHEPRLSVSNIQPLSPQNKPFFRLSLLITSSVATSCISSILLGLLISGLVIFSLRLNINPGQSITFFLHHPNPYVDNILTPIASSFGDLISISTFFLILVIFISLIHLYLLIIFLVFLIISILIITRLTETQFSQIASSTWIPLFISLLITSGSGLLFENYVYHYHAMAFMMPICQGLNGTHLSPTNIMILMTECRKYWLYLCLAHQYRSTNEKQKTQGDSMGHYSDTFLY